MSKKESDYFVQKGGLSLPIELIVSRRKIPDGETLLLAAIDFIRKFGNFGSKDALLKLMVAGVPQNLIQILNA